MIGRVVDITLEGVHLSLYRGFMLAKRHGQEEIRLPMDDIAVVLCHAHGLTYSNNLLFELSRRGACFVLCGDDHLPYGWLWPIQAHHEQSGRISDQIQARKPLCKRLWQQIVTGKIEQQAAILEAFNRPGAAALRRYAAKVRSGDADNIEAQAARTYWPSLMGSQFRRDRRSGGVNALLNYGYIVLRAATTRAVACAGLHPAIGIHHSNRFDTLPLVDDLMEPFRPIVDWQVKRLSDSGYVRVDAETKRITANLLYLDMWSHSQQRTVLGNAIERLTTSVVESFASGEPNVVLPPPFKGDD